MRPTLPGRRLIHNWLIAAAVALAAQPASAAAKSAALTKLQQQLATRQQTASLLAGQVKSADEGLKKTQAELVKAAQGIQASERASQALAAQIAASTAQQADLQKDLASSQASMSDLVLALARLRRLPPELLMARPGATLPTAQTAALLGNLLPAIKHRAEMAAATIKQLDDVKKQLAADQALQVSLHKELTQRYASANVLVKQRQALFAQANGDYAQNQAAIDKISKQARDLQDLVDKVKAAQPLAKPIPVSPAARAYAWAMPKAGKPELPVAGKILTGYGERDSIGAVSQGVTVLASPAALAVAPMAGTVRYAGPFRSYNYLVLLEHPDGYISLIAGLGEVDVASGQALAVGEPLGKLPETSSRNGGAALYYELRYHGQPVNPAEKIPDLKIKS